jgi:dolichol-phosphate mannosyltransferase
MEQDSINHDMRAIRELVLELEGPIAVFGAAGFIGANLLYSILGVRSDVYGITTQSTLPHRLSSIDIANIRKCNILNADEVRTLFEEQKFKTVLFFAAYGAYAKQATTELIYQTNVVGLSNVLSVSEENGVKSFIHAGSQSEYGLNCTGSREDWELEPNSHYSVSKIAAAYMIRYFGKQKGFPVVNLRLYSVYGPYEDDDRLVPKLIDHGMEGEFPPLVSPDISRDFVYVDDVVHAVLLASVSGCKVLPGESINICTGVKCTIRELASEVKDIFQMSVDPLWGSMENRAWDLSNWYGDPSKARELLGWRATTTLREGLMKTCNWRRSNPRQATIGLVSPTVRSQTIDKISAVIACYKDAQAIPHMYKRLSDVFAAMGVDYEIVFVNDCSPDDTNRVVGEIADKDFRVILIEHSRNFGSQSAFLSGMAISTGDAVVLMDGDLQDPPEMIPAFYERWKCGDVEVVYGRRVKREASFFMQMAYKSFYRLFKRLASIDIPLDAGDFSLIDRRVVHQLLKLPETDQFLRGLRAWVGFRQVGIDYVRPERMFGVTTNNFVKNMRWARKGIFSFSNIPLEVLFFSGLFLVGFAGVALVFTLFTSFYDPSMPRGIATIVCLILAFGGAQILATAIVGEYVGKILEETKARPKYIVKRIQKGSTRYTTESELKAAYPTSLDPAPLVRRDDKDTLAHHP